MLNHDPALMESLAPDLQSSLLVVTPCSFSFLAFPVCFFTFFFVTLRFISFMYLSMFLFFTLFYLFSSLLSFLYFCVSILYFLLVVLKRRKIVSFLTKLLMLMGFETLLMTWGPKLPGLVQLQQGQFRLKQRRIVSSKNPLCKVSQKLTQHLPRRLRKMISS